MARENYADDQQQIETEQPETGEAEGGEEQQPETGETEASEGDDVEEGEQGGEQQDTPRKRNRPGKLERQIERQQEQIARLEGTLQTLAQGQQQNRGNGGQQAFEQAAPQAPKYEDFDTDEAYLDALADYKVNTRLQQAETERQRQERERQQRAQQEQVFSTLQEKLAEGPQKYEDFDEVAYDDAVPITDAMAETLADSDHAADIAYYLGQNLSEAKRIAGLSQTRQAREITRLENRFAQPQTRKQSKAPAPTQRVRGGGGESATVDPDKMSMEEYVKWRRKQGSG